MSDPETPKDREEVLRSIRRIVGSDGRAPRQAENGSGRLVLGADRQVGDRAPRNTGTGPLVLETRAPMPRTGTPDGEPDGADAPQSDPPAAEPLVLTARAAGTRGPDLTDRIARLEAVVAAQRVDREEDGPGADPGDPTFDATEHARDEVASRPVDEAPSPEADGRHERLPGAEVMPAAIDGDVLQAEKAAETRPPQRRAGGEGGPIRGASTVPPDDAALRALVSEIVRQELQGVLGERITRNLRKLVRREIARSMSPTDPQ